MKPALLLCFLLLAVPAHARLGETTQQIEARYGKPLKTVKPESQGEYLHLQTRDGSIAPCAYAEDELRAAMQRLPEMTAIIREGIGSGVFFARASGSVRPQGHCQYCDFLVVCGKDRQRRQASKSEDPAVKRFSRLQEIDGAAEDEE